MIGIYKIINPNGRIYIGQSTNIEGRWTKYKQLACKDQPSLYSSLKKYNPENHIFEIIEECSVENLDNREIYWGLLYNVLSNKHLNNRLGRGFGSFDSEETKRKKSQSNKGISRNKGKILSEEHKEKIKIGKLGKKHNITKIRKDKGIPRNFHIDAVIKSKSITIYQFNKNNTLLNTFPSAAVAARFLNLNQAGIHKVLNKSNRSCGGFIWKTQI
jgi:group I intron endonuclease